MLWVIKDVVHKGVFLLEKLLCRLAILGCWIRMGIVVELSVVAGENLGFLLCFVNMLVLLIMEEIRLVCRIGSRVLH